MCRVSQFCCCCSLRSGVYFAVGYTTTLTMMVTAVVIWLLTSGLDYIAKVVYDLLEEKYAGEATEAQIHMLVDEVISFERILCIISLVMYLTWMVFALLMPLALVKQRRGFLMPWIVMTWILTVLLILGVFNMIRTYASANGNVNPYSWVTMAVYGLTLVANGCSICGVHSYYKNNLREESEVACIVVGSVQAAPPAAGQFQYHNLA